MFTSLHHTYRHNVGTLFTSPLSELSGALGDLGTLLPLMIALSQRHSISLSSTLVFTGGFNIVTGVLFGVPLPVQPMKAIAADSISRSVSTATITAAGGFVSLAVLLLTGTGLLRVLTRYIPVPVVKGIQLGAGLNLVSSVGGQVGDDRIFAYGAGVVLIFTLTQKRRIPFALGIFLLGVVSASLTPGPKFDGFSLWRPRVLMPGWFDGWDAPGMALGQLPLTTLNSIVAAAALSAELAPERPVSVSALGYSVAGMNLVGCWFGVMPVCHGAGGLAAQWRFGARSGASVILLGIVKMVLGLVFGDSLTNVIRRFPGAVLGVMVLGAGLELARVATGVNEEGADLWVEDGMEYDAEGVVIGARKKRRVLDEEERRERWMVLLVTMSGIVAFKNDAVGFIGGVGCFWFYRLGEWWEQRTGRGEVSLL